MSTHHCYDLSSQKLERLYIVPLIISSLSNVRRSKVVKFSSSLIPCGGHTRHEQDFAFLYGHGYSGLCIVTVVFSSTATRPPHAEETGNKCNIVDQCLTQIPFPPTEPGGDSHKKVRFLLGNFEKNHLEVTSSCFVCVA